MDSDKSMFQRVPRNGFAPLRDIATASLRPAPSTLANSSRLNRRSMNKS
jgi:hypothetical protein